MNERNTYAVSTRSVMEVAILDGGDRLAIAFLGGNSRPINVAIPISSALELASKIMQADIDAARGRLRRSDIDQFGELALLADAAKSRAEVASA